VTTAAQDLWFSRKAPLALNYNKEGLTDSLLARIGKYVAMPRFRPDVVGQVRAGPGGGSGA